MTNFYHGIFADQSNAVQKMLTRLKEDSIHKDVDKDFLSRTIQLLEALHAEVTKLLNSGDLAIPPLISSNVVKYNTFAERLQTIELFRFLPIINYGKPEIYFKKKISRIYREINCLQKEPFITTISNSDTYYWALPTYNVIAVPTGEEKNLLNLPDLYHEIGHLIELQYRSEFRRDFLPVLDAFYRDEEQRVVDEQRDPSLLAFYREKRANWNNRWIMEFICDFIATYLVGPAYAYTNLKISTHSSGKDRIYSDFPSHPSDEARMRAILYMLNQLGFQKEGHQINGLWQEFLQHVNNPMPSNYIYIFPQKLIEALGQTVYKACQTVDLRSYPDQISKFNPPISKILNDAWIEALSNFSNYKIYEERRISEIEGLL
ncbi:MAG: hypothetical protein P4L51_23915 [Puia sp.]|nr:hypothetical protein [Puia sp.]